MKKIAPESRLDNFIQEATSRNIRVVRDLGGICIAREVEIEGMIYAHTVEVGDGDVYHPERWDQAFEVLDRRFTSLLALEGFIPLPEKFRSVLG
jgi:hypothetical protein